VALMLAMHAIIEGSRRQLVQVVHSRTRRDLASSSHAVWPYRPFVASDRPEEPHMLETSLRLGFEQRHSNTPFRSLLVLPGLPAGLVAPMCLFGLVVRTEIAVEVRRQRLEPERPLCHCIVVDNNILVVAASSDTAADKSPAAVGIHLAGRVERGLLVRESVTEASLLTPDMM